MENALLVSLIIMTLILAGAGWLSKGIHININYNMPVQPESAPMEDTLYDKDGKPIQSEAEKMMSELAMSIQNVMLGKEEVNGD